MLIKLTVCSSYCIKLHSVIVHV